MPGSLEHWNKIKNLQIISMCKNAYQKWLDLWNIGTKLKVYYRLFQVAYHKGLDLWNIGTKLEMYR